MMCLLMSRRLLRLPPVQWERELARPKYKDINWQSLVIGLNGEAQRQIFLAEFLAERTGHYGCGVRDHADSVREANKVLVKVRKAMGYSYPKMGTLQF